MPWVRDEFGRPQFNYSVVLLEEIAGNYGTAYQTGLPIGIYFEANLFRIAEYLADFSLAYRHLPGKMQAFLRLHMRGCQEHELEQKGFYEPSKYKYRVFREMCDWLNRPKKEGIYGLG